MKLLVVFFFPVFMAYLDRQRGTEKESETIPKSVALGLLGMLTSVLVGHYFDWQAIVITISVATGYALSYGHPLGWAISGSPKGELEKWQIGPLKTNPWLALAVRGAFIGLFSLAAFDWLASLKITVAFAIAFPVSAYAAIKIMDRDREAAWGISEYLRGFIAGLILAVMSWWGITK